MTDTIENIDKILDVNKNGFSAEIAIVLGSGLSGLVSELDSAETIPYSAIPGLDLKSVKGHEGNFVLGSFRGINVLFLQGRPHWYQGASAKTFHIFLKSIQAFGCKEIIMTNAVGAIDSNIPVGSIVSITDHINLQFKNPLIDSDVDDYFLGMENAYDMDLRKKIRGLAERNKINLYDGVYLGTLGPCFETPAEIRAFRQLGAQVVGMSTIPEVITARYYGMRVAVLSLVSNLAAGCGDEELSHELTLSRVNMASGNMISLLRHYIYLALHTYNSEIEIQ
ncbi:MAG: purine-nucleoside phosphorylase [Pseudomonadota bacterium]|nr:purine-nucleoside phosphorylase [Pseudomonadota bacterium]